MNTCGIGGPCGIDFGGFGGLGGGFGQLGGGLGGGLGGLGGGFGRGGIFDPDFALDTFGGLGFYDPWDEARRARRRQRRRGRGRRAAQQAIGAGAVPTGKAEEDSDEGPLSTSEDESLDVWVPVCDIIETVDNKILLCIQMGGVKKEDLNIELRPWAEGQHNHLVVSGKIDEPEDVNRYIRAEIPTGPFRRTFKVPKTLKEDQVTAKYDNGMLHLTYPKAEAKEERPEAKKINVA